MKTEDVGMSKSASQSTNSSWSSNAAARLVVATAVAAVGVGSFAQPAHAASETWARTGNGTFNWNQNGAGNWSPDTAFPNGATDIANVTNDIGQGTIVETINLNQAITLNGLNIGDGVAQHANFRIATGTAGSLTLAGTNPFITFW